MKMLAAVMLVVALTTGCNTASPRPEPSFQPPSRPSSQSGTSRPRSAGLQGFDYYLLNLSWSPEFCYSHPNAPECGRHAALVLHGLWPQNSDGTYPQDCSNAPGPAAPGEYADIYPDTGLLEHEWRTHGTCSGLSADTFFRTARAAFHAVKTPPTLTQLQAQISLPPDQILSLVHQSNPAIPTESLALSCGNNYLTAIEVCMDKGLHPIACGPIRSCRARTVRIPPP